MNFVCDAVVVMDTDDAVGVRPVRARGMCSHVFDVYLFDEQLVGHKIPEVSSRQPALGYATFDGDLLVAVLLVPLHVTSFRSGAQFPCRSH